MSHVGHPMAGEIYLTNAATVAAVRRGNATEQSRACVGPGKVYGIMRRPTQWALPLLDGHVLSLMPTQVQLGWAKSGAITFDQYRTLLLQTWRRDAEQKRAALRHETPGETWEEYGYRLPAAFSRGGAMRWDGETWRDEGAIRSGSTLVCNCARGKPCHRQIAAEVLAAAGWRVVLDGETFG